MFAKVKQTSKLKIFRQKTDVAPSLEMQIKIPKYFDKLDAVML